jgi:hypothetical protein
MEEVIGKSSMRSPLNGPACTVCRGRDEFIGPVSARSLASPRDPFVISITDIDLCDDDHHRNRW